MGRDLHGKSRGVVQLQLNRLPNGQSMKGVGGGGGGGGGSSEQGRRAFGGTLGSNARGKVAIFQTNSPIY